MMDWLLNDDPYLRGMWLVINIVPLIFAGMLLKIGGRLYDG